MGGAPGDIDSLILNCRGSLIGLTFPAPAGPGENLFDDRKIWVDFALLARFAMAVAGRLRVREDLHMALIHPKGNGTIEEIHTEASSMV